MYNNGYLQLNAYKIEKLRKKQIITFANTKNF